jgi:hypothetical protein
MLTWMLGRDSYGAEKGQVASFCNPLMRLRAPYYCLLEDESHLTTRHRHDPTTTRQHDAEVECEQAN